MRYILVLAFLFSCTLIKPDPGVVQVEYSIFVYNELEPETDCYYTVTYKHADFKEQTVQAVNSFNHSVALQEGQRIILFVKSSHSSFDFDPCYSAVSITADNEIIFTDTLKTDSREESNLAFYGDI